MRTKSRPCPVTLESWKTGQTLKVFRQCRQHAVEWKQGFAYLSEPNAVAISTTVSMDLTKTGVFLSILQRQGGDTTREARTCIRDSLRSS